MSRSIRRWNPPDTPPGWKHTHTLHWYNKPRDSDEYRSLETPNIQGETRLYYPAGSFPLIYLEGEAIQARNMSSGAFWGSRPVYKVDVVSEEGQILYSNLYNLDENGKFTNFYGAKVSFKDILPFIGFEKAPWYSSAPSPNQSECIIKNGVITLRGMPVPPGMGIRLMGPDSVLEGPDSSVERMRYLDLSVSRAEIIEKELSEVLNEMARMEIALSAAPSPRDEERYNELAAKKEELGAELEELRPHIPDESRRHIVIDDSSDEWDPTHIIHVEVKKEGRHGSSAYARGSWKEEIPVMLLPWTDAQIARLALLETHARPELEALGHKWVVSQRIEDTPPALDGDQGDVILTINTYGTERHDLGGWRGGACSWGVSIYPDGSLMWHRGKSAPDVAAPAGSRCWRRLCAAWRGGVGIKGLGRTRTPPDIEPLEPWLADEYLSTLRDVGYNTYSIATNQEWRELSLHNSQWISRTASSSFPNQEPLLYHKSGIKGHEDCGKATLKSRLLAETHIAPAHLEGLLGTLGFTQLHLSHDAIKGEFMKKLWCEIYKPPPGYDLCLHAVLRHQDWEPTRHISLRRRNGAGG